MFESVTLRECRSGESVPSAGHVRSRAVRQAIDYIHAHLAESIHLEDIAGAAGLSVFHFSRTFRRATGLAPHRYLVQARIDRVKLLLIENGQSLAAIAEEAGFTDQSHMSKVFKRFAGTTPKHFRERRAIACTGADRIVDGKGNAYAA